MTETPGQRIYNNYLALFHDRPPWETLSGEDQKQWDDFAQSIT